MPEFERKRDRMIEHLEAALVLADELKDGATGLLIETALDQARADRVARGREGRRPSERELAKRVSRQLIAGAESR